MLAATAYGYRHTFTPEVLLGIFIDFVVACFTAQRGVRGDNGWGFDAPFLPSNFARVARITMTMVLVIKPPRG